MSHVRRRNGDDDALGRGAHKASVCALIEAGFARLKIGEDHGSLAVGAKRALAGSFAMEKRGNGPSEHDASLDWAGAQHSQSPITAVTGR